MKTPQEVSDDTAGLSDNERADLEKQAAAARAGMAEKSKEFMDKGAEIYLSESGEVREPIG